MKKLKRFLILPIILILAVTLTGCSGRSSKTPKENTTLYWWRVIGGAREETYEEIINKFEQKNPGIKIKVVSKNPQVYEEEMIAALAAHQSVENAPDIVSISDQDMPRFVPQLSPAPEGLFDIGKSKSGTTGLDSVEYVKENFEPFVAKTAILNNAAGEPKLYGLPIAVDNLALYINRDLLDKTADSIATNNKYTQDKGNEEIRALITKIKTPPQTWAELAEIVPYLTIKDGGNITRSAVSLGTSTNVERSYDILSTIMMQNGTELTSNNYDASTISLSQSGATTSKTPGEEALKFYLRFANPSDPLYTWNDQMPNSVEAFKQGQLVMLPHYASLYPFLINEMPSLKSSIEVTAMPQITSTENVAGLQNHVVVGKSENFCVPSAKNDTNRQLASWMFIEYLTSRSGSSPYLSAIKMPSALKEVDGRAKFETFDKQKPIANTWYKGHKAMQVDQVFISMIDDAYSGRKSVADSLNSASTSITTVLQASKSKWSGQ